MCAVSYLYPAIFDPPRGPFQDPLPGRPPAPRGRAPVGAPPQAGEEAVPKRTKKKKEEENKKLRQIQISLSRKGKSQPPVLHPALIQGEPGDEPRGLKNGDSPKSQNKV